MENRKQVFVEGEHCYSLAQQENLTMLYYSESESWNSHTRGQLALGLENTGNDFKIIGGLAKKNRVDYSESVELLILLSAVKKSKIEIFEKMEEL
jgi:hypothetical protein